MSEVIWGHFRVIGKAENDSAVVLVGQPEDQKSDEWWKLVHELAGTEGIEVAKIVQYDAQSASVGSVWRVTLTPEVYNQIGDLIPDLEAGDPPEIRPAPMETEAVGYEPLDNIFASFTARRLDDMMVITGIPTHAGLWKKAVVTLLVDGGAAEISKVYKSGPDLLAFWWRLVVPLEGLQSLEQGPREAAQDKPQRPPRAPKAPTVDPEPPTPPKRQGAVTADSFSQLPTDRRQALRKWLIVNRAKEPLRQKPGERAASAAAIRAYQDRVKRIQLNKDGKVTKMPLFDPFYSTGRLVIVENIGSMERFQAPGPGIGLETLPPTRELEGR